METRNFTYSLRPVWAPTCGIKLSGVVTSADSIGRLHGLLRATEYKLMSI